MSAHKTEDMVNSMLRDSPLPDTETSKEKLSEDGGSDKLPEEEDGQKLPWEGDEKLHDPLTQLSSIFFHQIPRIQGILW